MAAHHVSIYGDTLAGVLPAVQSLVWEPLCFLKQYQQSHESTSVLSQTHPSRAGHRL